MDHHARAGNEARTEVNSVANQLSYWHQVGESEAAAALQQQGQSAAIAQHASERIAMGAMRMQKADALIQTLQTQVQESQQSISALQQSQGHISRLQAECHLGRGLLQALQQEKQEPKGLLTYSNDRISQFNIRQVESRDAVGLLRAGHIQQLFKDRTGSIDRHREQVRSCY